MTDRIYIATVAFWPDSTSVHVNAGWQPIGMPPLPSSSGGMPICVMYGFGTDEAQVLWNAIRSAEWHYKRMLGREPGPWVPTSLATITHDNAPADPWEGQPYDASTAGNA